MKTKISFIIIIVLIAFSCNRNDFFEESSGITKHDQIQKKSLRSNLSTGLTTQQLREYLLHKYSSSLIEPHGLDAKFGKIGYGYDFFRNNDTKAELESQENITKPILPANSFNQTHIDINSLNSIDLKLMLYQNFIYDFSNHFYSMSDSSHFDVSLSGFKWLAKAAFTYEKSMKECTKQTTTSSSKTVFSQASVLIKSKRISLNIGSMLRFSPENRLNEDFYFDYHLCSPSELIQNYGAFVLTDYNIGGKVVANTGYTSKYSQSTDKLKEDASQMVGFSMSGLFGHIGSNINNQSTESIEEYKERICNYENAYMDLSFKGGSPYNSLPNGISFSDLKTGIFKPINLLPWSHSLDGNQVLISINKNGIIPIFKLIREENIAKNIKNYLLTGEEEIPDTENIEHIIYREEGKVFFAMRNKYNETFILYEGIIPEIGYEWWKYVYYRSRAIPFSKDLNPKILFEKPEFEKVIDLRPYLCANDEKKVTAKFCKLKNSPYNEDVTYLVIENKENRKKVAISFNDEHGFSNYGFEEPEEFEYIRNINLIKLYGI